MSKIGILKLEVQ